MTDQMKILIISDKPPWPGTSGGALAIMSAIKGLSAHGADLTVINASTKKHPENTGKKNEAVPPGVHSLSVRIKTGLNPFQLIVNLIFSGLPYNIARFNSAVFRKTLQKLLVNEHFDLVQIEGLNMSMYLDTIRRYSNAYVAIRSHNVEHLLWKRLAGNEKNKIKKHYMRILARRLKKYEISIINRCDLSITLTSYDRVCFGEAGIYKPSFIFPYTIDPVKKHRKKADNNTISYIGSLDWKPNQEGLQWFLNTVWEKIRKERPDTVLMVAGRNAPDWLEKKLSGPGIRYMGEISNAINFIAESGILIIPLLSGSGIRVRAIQSMALGTPVVTTNKGIEGIEAQNGKEILVASSAEEFTSHIYSLMEGGLLYDKLSENSVKFITGNYDTAKYCRELIDFYRNNIK